MPDARVHPDALNRFFGLSQGHADADAADSLTCARINFCASSSRQTKSKVNSIIDKVHPYDLSVRSFQRV